MNTIIIACSTLKNELSCAMEEIGCTFPVIWLESGLHNVPEKLRQALKDSLGQADALGADRVLLSFGFCGNALNQLLTGHFELILPRADDCISLLIGSSKRRHQIQSEAGTYFMTKGWLDGERNIWKEYEYALEKYGSKRGQRIFDTMFGNYKRIGILDTRCYPLKPVMEEASRIAGKLNLALDTIPASNQYLIKLLTGPWPQDGFLTVPPNTRITLSDLTL